jgi:hypothetical protein
MTLFIHKDIEVLIVSYGGVGTSFLIDAISPYRKTNYKDDIDGLKHYPLPPLNGSHNLKVVYIYGDPAEAVMSLFRRNYHHHQSTKLQSHRLRRHVVDIASTLSSYAERGEDQFFFADHFLNWRHRYVLYPTLYLHYDTIHDQVNLIKSFLDLPDKFLHNFPLKLPRNSSKADLSGKTSAALDGIYADFCEMLNSYPKAQVIDPVLRSKLSCVDLRYLIASLLEIKRRLMKS